MNRLSIGSVIAAICSMGRTDRYTVPLDLGRSPIRSSHKHGGGRGGRPHISRNAMPGNLRIAGDYFRAHHELCRKGAA